MTTSSESYIGIDIGGTFTDVVMFRGDGTVEVAKVPSTPPDFATGFMSGLMTVSPEASEVRRLAHGTTVATNALVGRRGARSALVTNRGFGDVLTLRRGDRADLYNLWWTPPEPLIPRDLTFEVTGRLDASGAEIEALNEQELHEIGERIASRQVEAVAIVFLHSFMNPTTEMQAKEVIASHLPRAFVCASYEVMPEILEYERTSTTAVNAYVGPVVEKYFHEIASRCRMWGYTGDVAICTSAGGLMGTAAAAAVPARTMASGPAAGVVGAVTVSGGAGFKSIITFDMGGTSLDVAVVRDGKIERRSEWVAPDGSPVRIPSVDVVSVGAGGGSLAWVDPAGGLHVGPESAGARPGPACYGAGGTMPTTTDAALVLGRLGQKGLLGGKLELNLQMARDALERQVMVPLGLRDPTDAAIAVLSLATHNMVEALRSQTIYRGNDPRDFALVAYGGAGPMFGPEVAREADIENVLIPPRPGLLCALGSLLMGIRHEATRSVLRPVPSISDIELSQVLRELSTIVLGELASDGVARSKAHLSCEAEVRYFGTTHAVTVELPDSHARLAGLRDTFQSRHAREYGYTVPSSVADVELVLVRVVGTAVPEKVPSVSGWTDGMTGRDSPVEVRDMWTGAQFEPTPVYARRRFRSGALVEGPAILEQEDSTVVLLRDMRATVDAAGSLIVRIGTSALSSK